MTERIMGIEIGTSLIKLIEVSKGRHGLKVEKIALLDTPRHAVKDGELVQIKLIQQVLLEEIKAKKYKATKVVVVLQSSQIIIRTITVETYSEEVIQKILKIHPQEYLPLENEAYEIDYKLINEEGLYQSTQKEILLVAVPKRIVVAIAELIKGVKKKPICITTPSEALSNVFGTTKSLIYEHVEHVLILDVGQMTTNVTIIFKDQAVLTRMIQFGIGCIEESLVGQSQSMTEDDLQKFINGRIEGGIVEEIKGILQFYYTSVKPDAIKKICLIGGGASIKGLKDILEEALNISVERFHTFNEKLEKSCVAFEHYKYFFVNLVGAINGL